MGDKMVSMVSIIFSMLTPDLEPSFAQVSFYHSSEGQKYKEELRLRSAPEELITIRTPLRATFEDDELDDYSDDDNPPPIHHIIDDLGDTPSRRLMSQQDKPISSYLPKYPSLVPSSNYHPKSLTNGLALTSNSISGKQSSSSSSSSSPNPNYPNPTPYSSVLPPNNNGLVKAPLLSSLPFSNNPPILNSYSLMPNNNYAPAGSYNNKSSSVTTPLIPLLPPVTTSKVNELGASTSRNGTTPGTTTYTSIIPNSQSSGHIHSNNSNSVSNSNTTTGAANSANNLSNGRLSAGGGGDGSGLESNESSKSCSVTFASGERNKMGNGGAGGGGGGNGYITLRHPAPVNETQKNRTTQF
jgi:hypothetical protein